MPTEDGKATRFLTKCGNMFLVAGEAAYEHSSKKVIMSHSGGEWVKPPKSEAERTGEMAFPFVLADDTTSMVLEHKPEGRRTCTDTERCGLRTLFKDMENMNFVDIKLHGHKLDRPGGAAGTDEHDYFLVEPDPQQLWVWKARGENAKNDLVMGICGVLECQPQA